MSKKISEFFKPKLEPGSDSREAAVKHEEEGDFVIKLDEIKKEIKIDENSPKIRDCRVVLKDFKEKAEAEAKTEEKSAKSKAKLAKRQQTNTKNDNGCNFCEKRFAFRQSLLKHQRDFHSTEIKNLLKCQTCGATFFKDHKFEQHMKTKHFIDEKLQFECDFDGNIFSRKNILLNHMQSHKMTVKCEICQAKVKPSYMSQHKKLVHSTGLKFQCKICSKSFKEKKILKNHEKTHNKKLECEICNNFFPISTQLNKHKKEYHENPKSFKCEACDKKFSQKAHLKTHEKTHDKNRPKPFKCGRCDYATDSSQNYKIHQNVHKRQDKKFAAMKNPEKCKKCPKFCRNMEMLRMHMKNVHPENLFQCDLCGKYLKVMEGLKKHLSVHQKQAIKIKMESFGNQ